MGASFQAKDQNVLQDQLKVQELVVRKSSSLCSVSGSDLLIAINEPVTAVRMAIQQLAADASLAGVAASVVNDGSGNPTVIKLTGAGTAAAGDVFMLKYITK